MISDNRYQSIVIFAEDPGALNYIKPLIEDIKGSYTLRVLASGLALKALREWLPDTLGIDDCDRPQLADADLLIVGTSENPRSASFYLIAEARRKGVFSIGIVDSSANISFRFCGETDDPLFYAPDVTWVPDQWTADGMSRLGYASERTLKVGYPPLKTVAEDLDGIAKQERKLRGFARGKYIVVFVSEVSTGLNPLQYKKCEEYSLSGRQGTQQRTSVVAEELLDSIARHKGIRERVFLLLRLHPKESEYPLAGWASEFDYVSTNENPSAVVGVADLVIGMSSMLLNQAYWKGRKCVSILPKAMEKNWLPITRDGHIDVLTKRGEIDGMVKEIQVQIHGNESMRQKNRRIEPTVFVPKEALRKTLCKLLPKDRQHCNILAD